MTTGPVPTRRPWRWIALVFALALLNASLTFRNVWPTPAVEWTGDLSIELAVCILGFALASRYYGATPRPLVRWLSVIWVVLAIGRYADVTAPAVYGREINLYWDLRHAVSVAGMLGAALSTWAIVLIVISVLLVWLLLHRSARWALACVADAMHHPRERRALVAAATLLLLLFAAQHTIGGSAPLPEFSTPVTESYARQAKLFTSELSATRIVPAATPLDGPIAGVAGADVFVLFIESYGAVAYDDPAIAAVLDDGRARLAHEIAAGGFGVVSAFVESPTFGGSSWLAHISLLTGIEVREEDTNRQIMAQQRDTLVTLFARNGYRTVGAMPGNSHPWPEGGFYRFDRIYNRVDLDYRGPQFGWWPVPDQFTLARVDQLEVNRPGRKPLFIVLPTISTHAPFGPTPPYLADWDRLLSAEPYSTADAQAALGRKPDLLNLGPSYANAVAYTYAALGGYVTRRAGRDAVFVVIGDHQPAAAVSGEGASWDVPVHVIASRPALLERLAQYGFAPGLAPGRAPIRKMHALLPVLVDAFRGGAAAAGQHAD